MLMTIEEKRDSIRRVFHVDDELDTLIIMCKKEGERIGLEKAKEVIKKMDWLTVDGWFNAQTEGQILKAIEKEMRM